MGLLNNPIGIKSLEPNQNPFIMNPYRFAAGEIGGWVEVGRTTLGSAGDTISVSSLPDKRYYQVLFHASPTSTANQQVKFNNSNSGYARRGSEDGGGDFTSVNQTHLNFSSGSNTYDRFHNYYIANLSTKEKLLIGHVVDNSGNGAGNAPSRLEGVGKWTNTSDAFDRIDFTNTNGGSAFPSGSEVVVLGWDPADTHTTNFWEELADTTFTSSGVSAQTFTAKKYLWFQFWYTTDSSGNGQHFQLGDTGGIDTGSTYARRHSINGGSDGTSVNQSKIYFAPQLGARTYFVNMFMVNNASNEKLVIIHSASNNGAGAGNAPQRRETVGKWVETTNQCDRIKIATDSGTFTGGQLKVWGAD